MSHEPSPAFQFYPKDFLSDAHQAAMSPAEAGVYIRLLCMCWLEGSLPHDLGKLARLGGVSPFQMKQLWPALAPCFQERDGGRLVQGRLEQERQKQADFRLRQAENGRLGGRPTKPNGKPDETQKKGVGSVEETQTLTQPKARKSSPSPSPGSSPETKELSPGPPGKAPAPVTAFLAWFQGEYKTRRHGAKYFVKWDAHGAIVKRLLTAFDPERLQQLATILLTTDEDWTTSTDRGIEVLSAKINWLEDRLAQWETRQAARASV